MPTFLTATWRHLLFANYRVPSEILKPYCPPGTEPDTYKGHCYVSLVAFDFDQIRLLGLPIPGHEQFPEVNLRTYVRRFDPVKAEWRRGVVFIKELVPKHAVAFVARTLFGENYHAVPMRQQLPADSSSHVPVQYEWEWEDQWQQFSVNALRTPPVEITPGSQAEFLLSHEWGYTQKGTGSHEYHVQHPAWTFAEASGYQLQWNPEHVYGAPFLILRRDPDSVFYVPGSEVKVDFSEKI